MRLQGVGMNGRRMFAILRRLFDVYVDTCCCGEGRGRGRSGGNGSVGGHGKGEWERRRVDRVLGKQGGRRRMRGLQGGELLPFFFDLYIEVKEYSNKNLNDKIKREYKDDK